jgi:putative transposase
MSGSTIQRTQDHARQTADRRCRESDGGAVGQGQPTLGCIDPAPRRGGPAWRRPAWREFLTTQARASSPATSCTSIWWTCAECTHWSSSNLAVELGVGLESLRFLIRDRDAKYTESFDAVFEPEDMEIITTPPRAPRANAHRERVIGTLRRETLDHMLLWSETHARHGLEIYTRHYNGHRPGKPGPTPRCAARRCRRRLVA